MPWPSSKTVCDLYFIVHFIFLYCELLVVYFISIVVTDSESATESSRVRPSLNPRIFCGHKWRFLVVCLWVNIYLSGGGVQATCVAASAAVWEIKRTPCRRFLPLPAVWSVTSGISQLQIIIWSGRGGGRSGRQRSGLRWRLCIVSCGRRAAMGRVDRVMCVGGGD